MQGRGTLAGLTEIVFVTNPPAPPLAAAWQIAPSLVGGPAAGRIGFAKSMPQILTLRFAIALPVKWTIDVRTLIAKGLWYAQYSAWSSSLPTAFHGDCGLIEPQHSA
jgi:hypothetical protein